MSKKFIFKSSIVTSIALLIFIGTLGSKESIFIAAGDDLIDWHSTALGYQTS